MANDRILFVDDDERILSGIERQFGDRFTLRVASGGADALHLIHNEETFAVIISDLRMPGMNGTELLRNAQLLSPHSICMMLTGDAELRMGGHDIRDANIFRVLSKPCEPETIEGAIRLALNQFPLS